MLEPIHGKHSILGTFISITSEFVSLPLLNLLEFYIFTSITH